MGEQSSLANTSVAMLAEDVHHVHQIATLAAQLEANGPSFVVEGDARVEISEVVCREGLAATVLRERHMARTGSREDVYFAFMPPTPERARARVTVLRDDLAIENGWVNDGEFEKIAPRHEALVRKTVAGETPDVAEADHEDLREFLRVLHAAISAQRSARTA